MSQDSGTNPGPTTSSNKSSFGNSKRYITSHDSSGKSVISHDNDIFFRPFAGGTVARAYAVSEVPVLLSSDRDLDAYLSKDGEKHDASHQLAGRQTTVPRGVNFSFLELAPGAETAMHRTVSLDFTIVLEGEIEMSLDGGDKVLLKTGDSVVQRATMHKWKNLSQENSVKVLGVLCASEQIEVGGKPIEEEWLEG